MFFFFKLIYCIVSDAKVIVMVIPTLDKEQQTDGTKVSKNTLSLQKTIEDRLQDIDTILGAINSIELDQDGVKKEYSKRKAHIDYLLLDNHALDMDFTHLKQCR